jgi:hypothetical protein
MLLLTIFFPVQIVVPLVFVIMDFGVITLMAFAVILVMLPFQSFNFVSFL